MEKELHQRVQREYDAMWGRDWKEIIGAPIVAIAIALLGYLFFMIAT